MKEPIRQRLEGPLRGASLRSYRAIRPHVLGPRVLDVGSAEGWVGERLHRHDGHRVQLLDVVDMNRTTLPYRVYDGFGIPFEDNAFDTTLLLLTLHHCAEPDAVLAEATRVTRMRLVVTESTYRHEAGRRLLWAMDTAVNDWRSRRLMPEAVHFRRVSEWRRLFASHGMQLKFQRHLSVGLHRHVLFVLDVG